MKCGAMILVGIILLSSAGAKATADDTPKQADIPYIDETVTLDGRMTEGVWKRAAVLDGFYLAGLRDPKPVPRIASEQTVVKVFHNTEAIYMGIFAAESRMNMLNRGVPNEEGYNDAPLEWTGDLLELFLQPGGERADIYHLAFNPNGARWDSSDADGMGWNGNWQVKTSIGETGWQAEVVIPFTAVSTLGRFCGTPRPKEEWRVNVCRAGRPATEYSSWSYTPKLFTNVAAFGRFLFSGTDTGIVLKDCDPGKLAGGQDSFSATLYNPLPAAVTLEAVLELGRPAARPREPVKEVGRSRVTLPANGTVDLKMPYSVQAGGVHELLLTLNRPDLKTRVYRGAVRFDVYPFDDRCREIKETLASFRQEIISAKAIAKEACLAEALKGIETTAARLEQLTSSNEDPLQKRIDAARVLEKEVAALEVSQANRVRPYIQLSRSGNSKAGFIVGVEYSGNKVFQDEAFLRPPADKVKVTLARNEYESCQLVMLPVSSGQGKISLSAGDLKGPKGEILPASDITWHRVGYINIKEAACGTRGGYWPDPLYSDNTVDISAGKPETMLLTVYAPAVRRPGIYQGRIDFHNDQGSVVKSMELEVEVYPLTLPAVSNFRMDFWFSEHHINGIYRKSLTPEFFREAMQVMGKYHLAAYPEWNTIKRNMKIYLEADGDLSFDFSGVDPYIEAAVENGLTLINISFCNSYQNLASNFKTVNAIDRKTDKPVRIQIDKPEELAARYLSAMYQHVLDKKWFTADRIYCDISDEPWDQEAKERLRKAGAAVKQAVPAARRYAAGTYPDAEYNGYLDLWCPQIRQFKEKDYSSTDELWWYQCLYKTPLPTFSVNRPGVELRTLFWMCRKYRVSGFLYWSSIYWGTSDMYSKIGRGERAKGDFWVHPEWPIPYNGTDFPGDALFFYPTEKGLIPNLRSLNMRDGIDDWEYLNILGKLMKEAESKGIKLPPQLAAEAGMLLQVPGEVVASPREYTLSAEKIMEMRERVARTAAAVAAELAKTGKK